MTAQYLLPCHCGRQNIVKTRQAGQTIVCACGASLQAPTLLDMTSLEPAPRESSPQLPPSTWGWRHRLRFLGTVLVLISLVGGVWLHQKQPISPFDAINPEDVRENAKKLPPSQTWDIWTTMKQGLDRRTDQRYTAAMQRFHVWQVAVAAMGLCGLALISVGVWGASGGRGKG